MQSTLLCLLVLWRSSGLTFGIFRKYVFLDVRKHFSFKKYCVHIGKTKVMPAPGRAPLGREVRGHKTVPDCHSELWLSYQDELVTEASDYFKTKPWQRMTDRNRQHMQGMADKFEDLRKSRQKAEAKVK